MFPICDLAYVAILNVPTVAVRYSLLEDGPFSPSRPIETDSLKIRSTFYCLANSCWIPSKWEQQTVNRFENWPNERDLRSLQSVVGEPMYPSGQVHLGVWLITLQMAVGAHGLPTAHGFMHWLFWHADQSGHSSLCEQPTARAGSVGLCAAGCGEVRFDMRLGAT